MDGGPSAQEIDEKSGAAFPQIEAGSFRVLSG